MAPVSSRAGALRWGQDRERHLLQHGLEKPRKEVPTLEAFAPRFIDDYAVANRQKPSGIAAKHTILNRHLVAALGEKRLDEITTDERPEAETPAQKSRAKDGEQRVNGFERSLEEGGRMGRDRTRAMRDPTGAGPQAIDGLLRLR